jgi:general secretion pathway protein E/type IV pilus assembly protein PilB
LKKLLSEITDIPYVNLTEHVIPPEYLKILDQKWQEKHLALVFSYALLPEGHCFQVAMADPTHLGDRDWIYAHLSALYKPPLFVKFFYADEPALEETFLRFFLREKVSAARVEKAERGAKPSIEDAFSSAEDVPEHLNHILQIAIEKGASDLHFHPQSHVIKVSLRVQGALQEIYDLHKGFWSNWCVRIKVLANLDIAESRRPQTGHFNMDFHRKPFDFRVSTHPTLHGESVVIRLFSQGKECLSLEQLGFSPMVQGSLLEVIHRPYGLILLCGPTGSGKTTTLYSLCAKMDASRMNIMTLEEPIEYQLESIHQTEISQNGVLNFADGVRSILRQDPDVLLIGEIRDEETAKMALRASMTGHLVLSTIHSNEALGAPLRFLDLGVPLAFLSGQILGILSQRLVRRTCPQCHGAPHGCCFCDNTGFKGRLALCEWLRMTEELDYCLSSGAPFLEWKKILKTQAHTTLLDDGLEKVRQNLTTPEELERVLGQA